MNVIYRQAASDDVVRQFQYYLTGQNLPDIAIRFRDAIRYTVESLRQHPLVGARYHSRTARSDNLRSWPVAGFEAIRIYYLLDAGAIHIIRVLHGKRDLSRLLDKKDP